MLADLIVILTATSPIVELRGAIPLAIGVYHFSPIYSFFLAVFGNILPVIFLLLFLEKGSNFLMKKNKYCRSFFSWWFKRTRERHSKKFARWKEFALVFIVALPLPFTGGWTGSLCAFLFGIPFRTALFLISLGIVIAGIIVTLISLGIF